MVIIGSDHTGIELKKKIINYLYENRIEYADVSNTGNQTADDYPDIAYTICSKTLKNSTNLGIAICGTGIGISIACNKMRGIRAALCIDAYMAEYSRKHNDANVLCLGARLKITEKFDDIQDIIHAFLNNFYEGGRHDARIQKIKKLEDIGIAGDL